MVQRHLQYGKSDSHPAGAHGQRGGKDEGIVINALAGEVMLGQPDVIETDVFGVARLGELLVDSSHILIWRWGEGKGEPAKLHVFLRFWGLFRLSRHAFCRAE